MEIILVNTVLKVAYVTPPAVSINVEWNVMVNQTVPICVDVKLSVMLMIWNADMIVLAMMNAYVLRSWKFVMLNVYVMIIANAKQDVLIYLLKMISLIKSITNVWVIVMSMKVTVGNNVLVTKCA